MNTYRVLIVYDVHADTIASAHQKVERYILDPLYRATQHQNLLPPEIVQTDSAALLISNIATPLERKNHGNGSTEQT